MSDSKEFTSEAYIECDDPIFDKSPLEICEYVMRHHRCLLENMEQCAKQAGINLRDYDLVEHQPSHRDAKTIVLRITGTRRGPE